MEYCSLGVSGLGLGLALKGRSYSTIDKVCLGFASIGFLTSMVAVSD